MTDIFPPWCRDHPGGAASHPRDIVHNVVSTQWQSVMGGRPPQDIDEDFFGSGASLVDAAAFASQLSTAFGYDISIQLIYENPTVRTLCSSIRSGSTDRRPRILPLGLDGDGAPLLFVPGAFGNPATFNRFGEPHFGRRVYGLECQGLWPDPREPLRNVAEVAKDFADEIELWRPAEPVHLTGYCTGAAYALELTRELIRRGWPVRSLTMLSPGTQNPEPVYPTFDEVFNDRLARIAESAGLEQYSGPFTASAIFAQLTAQGIEVSEEYVEEVVAGARMFVANYYAVSRYAPPSRYTPPPSPIGVPVAVLLPDDEDGDLAIRFWPDALGSEATFHRFACSHLELPFNDDVLMALGKVMRDADQCAESTQPNFSSTGSGRA